MELEDLVLRDVANADHFIEKLNEIAPAAISGEQPFFYAMGFHKPHQPWDAPQEFFDLYPEDEIDLPANPYVPEDMPAAAWSRFTGVLNFPDCSPEGTGIPDIGEANITYPDSKIKELRRGGVLRRFCRILNLRLKCSLLRHHQLHGPAGWPRGEGG